MWSSSRSGLTSSVQPGTPCGRIADSGIDNVAKPSTESASALLGMPDASERNVAPVHGSVVAVSTLSPPEPVQPAPSDTAVAGQVVVSCARKADGDALTMLNRPPATRSPFGSGVRDNTWSFMPEPNDDQPAPFQRAIRLALTPPAVVNPPPATKSPFGNAASASGAPFIPEPNADQLVPSHRAMRLAGTPPAVVNQPPATRSPLGSSISAPTLSFVPDPSGDQATPSQRAMWFALTPPAVVNAPPATRSPFGRTARAYTFGGENKPNIEAIGDQVVPSQRAMAVAITPPATKKEPPATRSPFGRTARADTSWSVPVLSVDQLVPSQRAMLLAFIPPAMPITPPTTRSPFGSTVKAFTMPITPEPSGDQTPEAGSQVAMLFAATVPAIEKVPPRTNTGCRGPAPSRSHKVVARTWPFVPGVPRPGSHCVAHWAETCCA